MEKIPFTPEGGSQIEVYVLEQTTIGGIDYFLTTEDADDEDGEVVILKDLSKKEDTDAVFEVVTDDNELNAVAKVFESLLDDVSLVSEDTSEN